MPKRKRQPDNFDVAEFLRESDDDLKSALNSLLRTTETEVAANPAPEVNLLPPINLERAAAVKPESPTAVNLDADPELVSDPSIKLAPQSKLIGDNNLYDQPNIGTSSILAPPIKLALPSPQHKRRFAIREMRRPADAHTRAEQHVYEHLWQIAKPYDEVSRTVTIGFGALANLVGLSESNARINLRSLLAKLAVEEIGEYNCELSQGRTYRIFNETEILRRRREAGLRWYMRRTLAVVFVDPTTGQPLLKSKPLRRQDPVLS
jgi:hypothetical protein